MGLVQTKNSRGYIDAIKQRNLLLRSKSWGEGGGGGGHKRSKRSKKKEKIYYSRRWDFLCNLFTIFFFIFQRLNFKRQSCQNFPKLRIQTEKREKRKKKNLIKIYQRNVKAERLRPRLSYSKATEALEAIQIKIFTIAFPSSFPPR